MVDIILGVVLLVAAIFLIIAVLLQSGKSKGVGAISGSSSETYFGKNKGKSLDKKLAFLTTIVSIIFIVVVLVVYVSQPYVDYDGWWWNNLIFSTTGSN